MKPPTISAIPALTRTNVFQMLKKVLVTPSFTPHTAMPTKMILKSDMLPGEFHPSCLIVRWISWERRLKL
ncbi:hypothetical protein Ccrd_023026 [Cynara cardunculus var. scolymus]|uniref:Uncharacterized protein n=1 Tax=Cynara cardunculus var. scolymus TaxID=59895 RepID=A0A103XXI5_CYNCS|nr:hypothetical protein Ccrd_023026 [Cynara cardunculus var. scolymus]